MILKQQSQTNKQKEGNTNQMEPLNKRVGRLITGSFAALVDAAENSVPEVVMAEALREVDEAVDTVKAELGRTVAQKKLAEDSLEKDFKDLEDCEAKGKLAMKENREDLAEAAAKKIISYKAQIPVLQQTVADCTSQIENLKAYIVALKGKREELEQEVEALNQARTFVESGATQTTGNGDGGSAEATVHAAEETITRLSKAFGFDKNRLKLDADTDSKMAELDGIAHDNEVKEVMESLRS